LNLTNIGSVKCKSSDTHISPNSIPALKCDRCFELQQTYQKFFTTGWGFKTT